MKFHYICNDCGAEYPSDAIIYRCPACSGKAGEGEMQRGNLRTVIDLERLRELGRRESVSFLDFFPYPVPTPEAYPVGNTPLSEPVRLREKYKARNC